MKSAEDQCPHCGYSETWSARWTRAGDPAVTIIAFWPIEERTLQHHDSHFISRCYYNTACHNARFDLQLISTPDQALITPGIPVISVEEPLLTEEDSSPVDFRGVETLIGFDHPASATYIIGSTRFHRPSDHFDVDHRLSIPVNQENQFPLYGAQVVPLIWYDRLMQLGLGESNEPGDVVRPDLSLAVPDGDIQFISRHSKSHAR